MPSENKRVKILPATDMAAPDILRLTTEIDNFYKYCQKHNIHMISIAALNGQEIIFRYNGRADNLADLVGIMSDTIHSNLRRESDEVKRARSKPN